MGIIGGQLGYHLLQSSQRILNGRGPSMDGSAYKDRSKLEVLLGSDIWSRINGKTVIDFGCGMGGDTVEMAARGAEVIGIDVVDRYLTEARQLAEQAGVADRCTFTRKTDRKADVVISIDAFEHYGDPLAVLKQMAVLLKPKGKVIAAFGPTWYHPLGGHLFSVFPWSHLIFTERALIRWRSDFKTDGAKKFGEVEGGLNQMTIRRFEKIVAQSPFTIEEFEPVPIKRLRPLANRLTREFTTAIVRCTLTL
ncbi:MAG TPA: methyltransferase domain-containing protein [Pyrinomonadaceae bacterium]